jgi:aspartate/methionine/tyrosine aminotransferase
MQLAESLNRLGTESAFEVLARAKALEASGRRIIHLQIGEPDFTTPRHIIDAGRKAWADGETHYCPAPGLPVLREACAAHLSRHRGLEIDPGQHRRRAGAKPFLFFGVLATCNPGDEVIYPNPGFPIYESVISWAGATPVPLPITEDRDFAFDIDDLAERLTPKTKLVILNSPANPTGGIVPRELNVQMAKLLAEHDCWILTTRSTPRCSTRARTTRSPRTRAARAHDPARRLLEDVRDDRLAASATQRCRSRSSSRSRA